MARPGLVWRTVRHLKPIQVWGQVRARVAPRAQVLDEKPALAPRTVTEPWTSAIPKRSALSDTGVFRFLNVERRVKVLRDWHEGDTSYLWFYNLQYHDWLNQAQFPGGRDAALGWLRRWAAENPFGTPLAWDPYPVSLRVVNWLRFALAQEGLPADLLQSACKQLRWLRQNLETHLLANHYFTNGKTLFIAGLFFAGAEAAEWLATGRRIVLEQLREQVLADGGHYERSPMYHAIVVEDVLDLLNAARTYVDVAGASTVDQLSETALKLLRWASVMRYADDSLPLFNDCAQNIAPTYPELAAYAQRLALVPTTASPEALCVLEESGFARIDHGPLCLFCEVGSVGPSYQPGHAHAGTLSFELALRGRRLLVNTGTSTYDRGIARVLERATAAHNTVEVDGASSSEVWASFRVGMRAHAQIVRRSAAAEQVELVAEHDGYVRQRIAGPHQRTWRAHASSLAIEDELRSIQGGWLRVRFHFAPGLTLRALADGSWQIMEADKVLGRFVGDPSLDYTCLRYLHHDEFGGAEPAWLILGRKRCETSSVRLVHRVEW